MVQLIKKDLIVHKFGWFIYFAMLAFYVLLGKHDSEFIIALLSAIVTVYVFYFDEHANGHKLWNALPFTRNELVSARYIVLLINTMITSGVFIVISVIIKGGWEQLAWQHIVGGFALVIICSALFFPCLYGFAQSNRILLWFILYVGSVVIGIYVLSDIASKMMDSTTKMPLWSDGMLFGLSLFAICLYLLSWLLSLMIYKKKEII
ncbi:ABC-2 transporter permease [Virgibacillus chiguensis]|uniref:ABC-2 family transporter protein n=1 Tax=Virgibacillus chiguensis TaxID=411959 RepID=A0A1M5WQF5_9BACI|nr:ABC-2 transporter permease [Virgibacillus chiguensis]SHH89855.1 ABC-2 family transporter protein [Virgibacillus chiguensis]